MSLSLKLHYIILLFIEVTLHFIAFYVDCRYKSLKTLDHY